jgi:flavin reductase (DIM6/NTAB) family NADH-FMN oxidoreductase RutF
MTVAPRIDPLTMRRVMGSFATGVAVVTTEHGGVPHGMTVNSLTSVSLEPAMLLVCFNEGARSADAVLAGGRFVVNILGARQEAIAMRFAQRGEDHFAGLHLEYGNHAVPVVPGALAHLECEVHQATKAGDHTVVVGSVLACCANDGAALGFFRGRFSGVTPHGDAIDHWFF